MPRGPLPRGMAGREAAGSVGGGLGIVGLLELALAATPPMARVALARTVRAWADRVQREALEQMGQAPEEDAEPRRETWTTTGHTR